MQTHSTLNKRPVYPSASGPWIVGGGVPVTLEDYLCRENLLPGWHCVPTDRRYGLGRPAEWIVLPSEVLMLEARAGQPLKFTLAEARDIFNGYWGGYMTQDELAVARKVSRLTIHRLVHKITYWWL